MLSALPLLLFCRYLLPFLSKAVGIDCHHLRCLCLVFRSLVLLLTRWVFLLLLFGRRKVSVRCQGFSSAPKVLLLPSWSLGSLHLATCLLFLESCWPLLVEWNVLGHQKLEKLRMQQCSLHWVWYGYNVTLSHIMDVKMPMHGSH